MSQLVHLQTQVSTVFGLLDADGNAIPQEPIVVNIQHFKQEAFADAHKLIAGQRDQALASYEAEQTAAKRTAGRPKR